MNELPVMKLNHTPELEDAMIAAIHAEDSRGRKIMLCRVGEPADVARRLLELAGWVQPGNVPIGPDTPAYGYENTLTNVVLLANLLKEHVKAGNWRPDLMRSP